MSNNLNNLTYTRVSQKKNIMRHRSYMLEKFQNIIRWRHSFYIIYALPSSKKNQLSKSERISYVDFNICFILESNCQQDI